MNSLQFSSVRFSNVLIETAAGWLLGYLYIEQTSLGDKCRCAGGGDLLDLPVLSARLRPLPLRALFSVSGKLFIITYSLAIL